MLSAETIVKRVSDRNNKGSHRGNGVLEKRAFVAEIRAAGEDEDKKVSGLGIIYDKWTELWPGYKERINKGAVQLAGEVKSYFNHDPSMVLSTINSTPPLELKDTDKGMEYSSPIPPTSYGKDLEVNLERQNVKGSSFAFDVEEQKRWDDDNGVHHREIKKLILYEIGPVTDPAFVQTTASLNSAQEAVREWRAKQKPPEPPAPISRNVRERKQKLIESMIY